MRTEQFNILIRLTLLAIVALLLTTQTGCQLFRRFGTQTQPVPAVFDTAPTQQQLITTLNARAAAVKQLKTPISLSMDGLPKIKGTLQLERPDRIRIKAGLMGISELGVDVGSNSELFWVWSKAAVQGQTPAIYYARHEDYRNGLNRAAIPLEPQWIIDATGLIEFGANEVHQGPFPTAEGLIKLHTIRQTPAGPIRRVAVIEPSTAQVFQQAIYDSSNRMIAYSDSKNYHPYTVKSSGNNADSQISLPHWIELHVFGPGGEEIKLVVETSEYKVNSLYGDPDKMWSMPTPEGVPAINLAKVSPQ